VLAAFFLCSLQGCVYYKALTVKPATAQEIRKYDSENKYLILHRDTSAWHLSGIVVNDEGLAGNLSAVPIERSAYHMSVPSLGRRYERINESDVLDQVHLYLKDSIVPKFDSNGHIKVALTDIQEAEVYQKDGLRSTLSWAIPLVLIGPFVVGFVVYATQ
jgi:hypothetical protein